MTTQNDDRSTVSASASHPPAPLVFEAAAAMGGGSKTAIDIASGPSPIDIPEKSLGDTTGPDTALSSHGIGGRSNDRSGLQIVRDMLVAGASPTATIAFIDGYEVAAASSREQRLHLESALDTIRKLHGLPDDYMPPFPPSAA